MLAANNTNRLETFRFVVMQTKEGVIAVGAGNVCRKTSHEYDRVLASWACIKCISASGIHTYYKSGVNDASTSKIDLDSCD